MHQSAQGTFTGQGLRRNPQQTLRRRTYNAQKRLTIP